VNVGVFGSSLPAEGEDAYEEARRLGLEIARRGARVVCGGYGGVMEAACRGAAEAGGASIGVVLAGRGAPNRWVTETVAAADLGERLRILRDSTDAWIFLPRGLGTMLELVWIAESVMKAEAPPRPFVLLGPYWRTLVEMAIAEGASPAGLAALRSAVRSTTTVPEAVAAVFGTESP
jgi:uncharacterized protein (TIGR00730 family)